MKQKHDIQNFYIGELYISSNFGNLLAYERMDKELEGTRKQISLCVNGAIDFQRNLLRKFVDREKFLHYEGLLTIFYKEGDSMISLHDSCTYSADGEDFYKNLIPLTALLPKIDFTIPTSITTKEALFYFDALFKPKKNFYANGTIHMIEDFYVGTLHLYEGFLPERIHSQKYEYANLPQKYALYKNGAKYICSIGQDKPSERAYDSHDSSEFKCLFLRTTEGLYNVHNYQVYNQGVLEEETFDGSIEENYYDQMIPFTTYLQDGQVKAKMKYLTIPKAIQLYKKAK